MARKNPIKRIFDLYTSDLSFNEIERLIKRDASEVYEFFANDIPKPDRKRNKFMRALIFLRSLFNAFILKLSPGRRLFYLAAIAVFFIGLFQEINSYTFAGFFILNILLAFELADKLTVKDDLELAQKIQSELLPKDKLELENYSIASFYEAAREVGGDYFDLIKVDEDKKLLVVGDISGKGLAAALYMVKLQTILQLLTTEVSSSREVLIRLNELFSKKLSKGYFLTIVSACFESNGTISICRAGHTPVLHYRKKEDDFVELKPNGLGIGFNNQDMFEKTLEVKKITPERGDILFFYTDGVTEAMNEYKQTYGEEFIKKIIQRNSDNSPELIKERIMQSIIGFRGNASVHDDLTMVILKAE